MALFSQQSIERVKEATDIAEVISAYTDLRRAGQRLSGLCPFHEERTPSFSVNPGEGLYHCFGCGVGGDVIKFVEEKEGLAFGEAVEALAERYGVEVEREEEDPRAEEARKRRARLGEVLERTAAFYASFLWEAEEAGKAREYLASRGLGEEVLREFGVGFAPSAWDSVLTRGQSAGYSLEELHAAGLLTKNKQGNPYDAFRRRIMFPIRDARKRMQGFGGRALTVDQKPKYKNSPEGELFRKKSLLYGLDRARPAIAKAKRVVVVEGYTDVLAAHQAGITETVGVMGTAITPDQVAELAAHIDQAVLAMDADSAGREAMIRVNRTAADKKVDLYVAEMGESADPADLLTGDGAGKDAFESRLNEPVPLSLFQLRHVVEDADLGSPAKRERVLNEVVPILAALDEDSLERMERMSYVQDRLRVEPAMLAQRIRAQETRGRPPEQSADAAGGHAAAGAESQEASHTARRPASIPLNVTERRELALLAMSIAAPGDGQEFLERLTPAHLSSPLMGRARDWLAEHLEDPMKGLPREDEELVSVVTQLVMSAEREPASREAMELNFLELDMAMVEREIEAATEGGGDTPVDLQRRRAALAERIAHSDAAR